MLADEAAGLGDRDADDAGEVPAGRVAVLAPAARVADLRARVLPDAGDDGSGRAATSTRRWWCCRSPRRRGWSSTPSCWSSRRSCVAESPRGLNDLYVALTRATQRLTVVHAEPLPPVLHRLAE